MTTMTNEEAIEILSVVSLDLIDDDYTIVSLEDFLNNYYMLYKNKMESEIDFAQYIINMIIDSVLR